MFLFAQTIQRHPQKRTVAEIKGRRDSFSVRRITSFSRSSLRQMAQIDHLGRNRRLRCDDLLRQAVNEPKNGAQRLVAPRKLKKRLSQRIDVQLATQTNRARHAVGDTFRLELMQKPQPLLGKRQRQAIFPRNRHDLRQPHAGRHPPVLLDIRRQGLQPSGSQKDCEAVPPRPGPGECVRLSEPQSANDPPIQKNCRECQSSPGSAPPARSRQLFSQSPCAAPHNLASITLRLRPRQRLGSTLPFGVNGIDFNSTKCWGTM